VRTKNRINFIKVTILSIFRFENNKQGGKNMKTQKLSLLLALTIIGSLILPSCHSSSDSGGKSNGDLQTLADRKTIKHIYSNRASFAALTGEGKVITWGQKSSGGDSSKVADQLQSAVKEIVSNRNAYAAIKNDGSVITWGDAAYGGDSSAVTGQLKSAVKSIVSNPESFAALKADGSVVTWGKEHAGGDSSKVSAQLKSNVVSISATRGNYAALKDDGSVVHWGADSEQSTQYTISFSTVANKLKSNVKHIYTTSDGFAALKTDGSVVTWGSVASGGDSSDVAEKLKSGVKTIYAGGQAFAALKDDGSVVTWNAKAYNGKDTGADSSDEAEYLKSDVKEIIPNFSAFAAIKNDGSVITWGKSYEGGSIYSDDKKKLKAGVAKIFAGGKAFAALLADGSLMAWGDSNAGGSIRSVESQLKSGIKDIVSKMDAQTFANSDPTVDNYKLDTFVALKTDGSLVEWGHPPDRGQFAFPAIRFDDVKSRLSSGVKKVFSSENAFAALKDDGTVVTWGDEIYGGNSEKVFGKTEDLIQPICALLSIHPDFRTTIRESKQKDPVCLQLDVSITLEMKEMKQDYESMISTGFGSRPAIPGQFKGTTKRHEECTSKIIEIYTPNESKCKLKESLYQFKKTSENYIQEMKRYEADLP
jgi:alpha-tubulin suppressor-like RCC1 family protein